jgi:hypothetical protein
MKTPFLYKLIPKALRLASIKQDILRLYQDSKDAEIIQVTSFLKSNKLGVFPYAFPGKYPLSDIKIWKDSALKMYFTELEGKKLYFKPNSTEEKAKKYFRSLLLEQDPESPHRYVSNNFFVTDHDVLADVGSAEGNFSLEHIEKLKTVHLFEKDPDWIKALEATFKPWSEKINIVPSYVGNRDSEGIITLDSYFKSHEKPELIKADVEGAEFSVLEGAKSIMKNTSNLKIAVCTYHNQYDADLLSSYVLDLGFKTEFSKGYMLFYYGKENIFKPPYLRRGLLRGWK